MLTDTLNKYGKIGVEALRQDVNKVSATGKTADSIRYEVITSSEYTSLIIYGRAFFKALETGRGPRRSSEDSGFKDYMLEYMRAKGIGSDLSEKKRQQLAKFLVLKINREGDATFKRGGRVVYTPTLEKLKSEVITAAKKEVKVSYTKKIIDGFKRT